MLKKRAQQVLSPVLSRFHELDIQSGKGCYLYDQANIAYLDFGSGIAVTSTGHCHPKVVAAVQQQVATLIHPSIAVGNTDVVINCAEKILSLFSVGDYSVFFEQSGAGAVEAALKLAKYVTKRHHVLAFEGGFHGRSMGALSVTTSKKAYRDHVGPMLEGVSFFPFPNTYRSLNEDVTDISVAAYIDTLKHSKAIHSGLAAVIIEPILGEGGYVSAPIEFLQCVAELCKQHNVLLIVDEVQSGIGRTGTWFQFQKANIVPDIVTLAKGLGSGMPIAACVAKTEFMNLWDKGSHGGTYGANPVTCVAASATIDVIAKQLSSISDLAAYAELVLEPLRSHIYIGDIRVEGLMIGIECVKDKQTKEPYPDMVADILKKCLENHLIVLSCGIHSNVIRLAPPLIISQKELKHGLMILIEAIYDYH
ncbi:aspartate aminotransferase family protein [bacterium]|nr:aspartate aminotransferase family protein [bacterium]